MNFKNTCTTVLLMFIAASIVVLVVKSLRQGEPATTADDHFDGLIVYYFHRKARCPACRNIEVYSHEAVIKGFPVEVGDGRIEWRVVDFELPENQYFAKEYELIAPSVVLVEMRGGVRKRWKNLPEVWELVGDKPAFVLFVQKEIQAFLNAK
jgi:hypothetical protein